MNQATIWKAQLLGGVQSIPMPEGAIVVACGMQSKFITIWYLCDPAQPLVNRHFCVIGTGHPAPTPTQGKYIGIIFDDIFVWHVFERIDNAADD